MSVPHDSPACLDAPLARALAAFEGRFGAGRAAELVTRVEARRDGGLVLHAETEAGPRWLATAAAGADAAGDGLVELRPADDARLPLARALADLAGEGAVRVLAWRPGRRIVLRVEDADGPVILKGYRRGRSLAAAARTRAVAAILPRALVTVPALWRHDAEREALALEPLAGSRPAVDPESTETFFRLGAALARLQAAAPDGLAVETHDRAAELAVLDGLAGRVRAAAGERPTGWDAARAALGDASERVPATEPRLAHRDLHDGQLVVGERRVGLLDLDLLCRAEPALDLGNLTAHLALRGLQAVRGASREGADALGEALLEGFDPPRGAGFFRGLRWYQAATFLRLALLYRLRPRWHALPPTLVRLAERSLQELER